MRYDLLLRASVYSDCDEHTRIDTVRVTLSKQAQKIGVMAQLRRSLWAGA